MDCLQIDVEIGRRSTARRIKPDLKPFTVIGVTERVESIMYSRREHFRAILHLDFYRPDELATMLRRSAGALCVPMDELGAMEIASRARGTPRTANRLLRRVRDFAQVRAQGVITRPVADQALQMLEVDHRGLDKIDRTILLTIIDNFSGGPVGLDTLAAVLGEEPETIEYAFEPFLLQQGYLRITSRGRAVTPLTLSIFKKPGHC